MAEKKGLGNGCPLYKKCGGCQLQNMTYEEQLIYKQKKVERLLGSYGKAEKIIGMKSPYHYRNKVQAAFGKNRYGQIISGVYQSNSHRIVPVSNCRLEDMTADKIIGSIRKLAEKFKLTVYDERTGRGLIRHVLVKRSFSTSEVMAVIVVGEKVFKSRNAFLNELLKLHPEITTVVINHNPERTNLVLGKSQTVIYGDGYITDELLGLKFRISPSSFYQINPIQTKKLYNIAIDYANLKGKETVIDAYCGTGTIGLAAAKKAKKVIGVELNADAVKDAKVNAEINGIENAEFYCGDAGRFLTGLKNENIIIDTVFTDPPRSGCTEEFLNSLIYLNPEKIVYISCNPETQARDLMYLTENGYKVDKIQPVDMFPHTGHVESVVLMSRAGV